ncbi:MAG TPA: dienelactone hydrolase family protein [Aggregatilineales bacterium]|nr:dienelactone hydrolase family protein [Aggregatilineales bacterium]
MPEARKLQHRITSGYIQIVSDSGNSIPAFWAHPQSGGPFPGLVLLHDDRGLSAHTRALVQRFAEVGYYVVAPDLFEGQRPTSKGEADALERYYTPSGPDKVSAALAVLESHHKSNNKMAIIGWDFGGTLVYDIAVRRNDVMAGVSFYGNPVPYLGKFDENLSPLLAIFGEHDQIIRQHESRLREELIRTGRPHEVIVYPGAQHNFYNDSLDTYHAESAEDAWVQTLAFLETHQGKPPAPDSARSNAFRPGQVY